MSEALLFSGQNLRLLADATGVRLAFTSTAADAATPESWPPPSALSLDETALLTDMQLLLEQELATIAEGGFVVSTADWAHAVTLGASSLTAFSSPSHLLLQVDRESELGRADFRYILRWIEGGREIAVERLGPFVRHLGSGRVMHLDPRTVTLVNAMEQYNALTPSERTKVRAFTDFATVRSEAAAIGALLDEYLESNTVVIPANIGLTIRENSDGSVTFEPRVPDLPDPDQFVTQFNRSASVPEVDTLTTPDGRRVRVLFSEAQREVLRRMQRVRRVGGEQAKALREDPAPVFDGVADAIDLSDVRLEYGPRVIGVGPLKLPTEIRAEKGRTMTDLLGLIGPDHAGAEESAPDVPMTPPVDGATAPEALPAAAPAQRRVAVALDLVNTATKTPETVRFSTDQEIRDFGRRVDAALTAGRDTIEHLGETYAVEPELKQAIDAHLTDPSAASGSSGKSGHLYLLIDEHESTLTEALLVDDQAGRDVTTIPPPVPASLRTDTTLQPHQLEGIRWLAATRATDGRRGGILADDMGLGKTLQLLAHVAHLIESGALDDVAGQGPNGPWRPVLIIAPLILVDSGTWTDEMRARFSDDGRIFEPWLVLRDEGIKKVRSATGSADLLGKPLLDPAKLMRHKVVITTYETLMAYQHSLAQRIDGKPLWSLVIFDEAQKVKSVKTKNTYASKAVDARYKIAATGTPVETRMLDLWSLLDTVEPTRFGTQRTFVSTYERPAMNAGSPAERHAALQSLRTALQYQREGAFLLRRDKTILTGLPPKTEHRPQCHMTDAERAVSVAIRSAMRSGGGAARALSGLQQLHLASQHPFLAQGRDVSRYDTATLLAASSRLQQLLALLRSIKAQGEKVLIFARSVPAQRMLAQVIGREFSRQVDIVNGEAAPGRGGPVGNRAHRRRTFDRFRSEPGFSAIVLSPFVAGVGLTLVEANHVVHYGRWWNPAVENQATDRAYRIGQTKPVHVYYPIAHDQTGIVERSFDEALDDLMTARRSLATDFLVPAPDGDVEDQLVAKLLGSSSEPVDDTSASTAVLTASDIARLMVATARAKGLRAHWLGPDGRFGADAIIAYGETPTVIGVSAGPLELLTDRLRTAVATWRQHISTLSRVPVAVSTDSAVISTGGGHLWKDVILDASECGVTISTAMLDVDAQASVEGIVKHYVS